MDLEFEDPVYVQDDLVCRICDAEFLDREDLDLHIAQFHINEHTRKRFCKLCAHIYPDIHEYALHLRNDHLSELKSCKHCFVLFASLPEVQEHEKKHKAGILYPRICCSQCNKVFDNKNEVRKHELDHHSGTVGMLFKDCLPIMSSLLCMNINDFLAAAHNNLTYVCTSCSNTTLDVKEYLQHLNANKCSSYACDNCLNVFKTRYRIRRHVVTHSDSDNTYTNFPNQKCPGCKKVLKDTPLRVHLQSCKEVTCKQCEMTFESVAEYANHRLTEHSRSQLSIEVCIYCQRQIVGEAALKKHMERTHGKDKHLYKYHCTYCDKIYKHPQQLFAHFFSTHKDLRPYTCRICKENFRIRKNFTLHIKLRHDSVGFVEFDDNFHVYFTDKKSAKKPNENEQTIEQSTSNNQDDGNQPIDKSKNNTSNETSFGNDHDFTKPIEDNNEANLFKDESEIEIEITPIEDHCEKDQGFITEKNVTEHTFECNDIKGTKLDDKEMRDRNNEKIEETTTDCEMNDLLREKRIRKRPKRNTPKKKVDDVEYDTSSDDSDVPLKMVVKKMKTQNKKTRISNTFSKVPSLKPRKKKFYCRKCKRNCYTYQNFHRHLALHTNQTKVCVKCFGKFNSVDKLNEHIKNEHSSSQLTETLKKLLEKRKKADEITKVVPKSQNSEEPPANDHIDVELSTSEKFRNTIKKVNIERNTAKVTMKLIDKDKISVKKFLESFNPENNEVKITMLKTVAHTAMKQLRPLIKLTKVNTEPVSETGTPKLKMPVKFKSGLDDKCHVNIQLTTDYVAPKMKFGNPIQFGNYDSNEQNDDNTYDDYDDRDMDNEAETKDDIPDVAQEVMLEGTEEPNIAVHNVRTIKNLPLPAWNKVQIATLSNEAPYYKITKINLNSTEPVRLLTKEPEEDVPKEVILSNGTKLVSANPFAHLLDHKKIDELLSVKRKKQYYTPRLSNAAQAISKALENIEKCPIVRVKKQKKNVV